MLEAAPGAMSARQSEYTLRDMQRSSSVLRVPALCRVDEARFFADDVLRAFPQRIEARGRAAVTQSPSLLTQGSLSGRRRSPQASATHPRGGGSAPLLRRALKL